MRLSTLRQLFSFRDLRNALVGIAVVFGGIGLSLFTLYAHQAGDVRLAGISAAISLIFVLLILIFVVPPLARNASREASQMNLPFEFTTGGAVMLVLLTVVGFSAWNTGNNLLFLVLSFLIAGMIVGFFAGSICLKRLDVKMRFPETIFAGEPTPILISVTNRKRIFPSLSVVAQVRGTERERSIAADELKALLPRFLAERLSRPPMIRKTLDHIVYIPRRQSVESRSEHIFLHRGRFVIKDFELSTRFPFGFFRHRRRLPARETELIVFPTPLPFDDNIDDLPLDAGKFVANKHGMGQDLLALRDYQPNDDLRRIDWKATARSSRLTVREFAAEDEKRVTVAFDTQVPDERDDSLSLRARISAEQSGKPVVASDRFEAGASLAASILLHFAEQQAELKLVIDDDEGEFGIGRIHLYEMLKRLSIIEPSFPKMDLPPEPATDLERILNSSDDSHWFLVTASADRDLSPETLQRLIIIGF
ncbi:MAG TPA: DUF58 domain-containing protein [Pyrinomonadaceae bacterium]|nr:DUF58 domain-containing protein [Chloracidobacterium sp.]MBP9935803.1 DUF58 domain-containing protein [Pyrinomonadaceae bacterium]MBK9767999.1 DUF58 domain-containing protein [Chloracidobacterium sp.]MBL0240797.1 DUF58 domain-containing protein [Chloracidobacterium sp.]HQX56303.1 DUF58 domain-containing protein [Pyrinomonadaceae bacterium]